MFTDEVKALIEEQGTTLYVSMLLGELSVQYVDDVPEEKRDFFLRRVVALQEEGR